MSHLPSCTLGSRVQDPTFQDAVTDTVIAQMHVVNASTGKHYYPTNRVVGIVYGSTFPGDPFRRLMVNMYVTCGKKKWTDHPTERRYADFSLDLARVFYDLKETRDPPVINDLKTGTCAYHHHGKGLCYNCKRKAE